MTKYLEKYIQSLSHKTIISIFNVLFILSVVGLFLVFLSDVRNYIYPAVAVLLLFTFLSLKLYQEFRKKQIEWLKNNGVKLFGQFDGITRGFASHTGRTPWYIWVKADVSGVNRIFKSNSIYYGRKNEILKPIAGGTYARITSKVKEYLENHPSGITIFVSRSNHNVYWVDTDWLQILG